MEIWKDIEGYEGLYKVSNLGRVKSLKYGKERILKPGTHRDGYLFVTLCKNGKRKSLYLHRLVGEAFLENPENWTQVNHIDENKLNNRVTNLEWCDQQYNIRYSKAKKIGCYKDGKLIKVYEAVIDVSTDGFNFGNVCSCCLNRYGYKSHKGFQWKYLE